MISEEYLTMLRDCARLEFPEIPDIFFEHMDFTVKSKIKRDRGFAREIEFIGSKNFGDNEDIIDAITSLPRCAISSDADYSISENKLMEFDGMNFFIRLFFYTPMPEEDVEFLMEMGNLAAENSRIEATYHVVCNAGL